MKYICKNCMEKLELSSDFKKRTLKTIATWNNIKNAEYLDENILEDQTHGDTDDLELGQDCDGDDLDEEQAIQPTDETCCIYCGLKLPSVEETREHIRDAHALEPRTGLPLKKCLLCGDPMKDPAEHINQCRIMTAEFEGRQYSCHFCEKVFNSRKACHTHIRMKHGLKFTIDQAVKNRSGERKKCSMCSRDFSQKQILNKHMLKVHGVEDVRQLWCDRLMENPCRWCSHLKSRVEKRKAFVCPLCDERVSYGCHLSSHLLHTHKLNEQVEHLEFYSMDDFLLFKSAIQEETKHRFRKTTASKQIIEGVRSHYMCSQSGVYVYQGKGKRATPKRQIYKTGKACPAHMIVTETLDRVLVVFYKTHVGHGPCPYYEPREPKKTQKIECVASSSVDREMSGDESCICDTCGLQFANGAKFNMHIASHSLHEHVPGPMLWGNT